MTARTAVRSALLALAAACAALALGTPRFTWENAGLTVQHPPHQGSCALLGAAALAAVALSGTRRPVGVLAFALALAAALAALGAQRLAWKVEAVDAGLHERTLTGWTRVAWRDVELVEPQSGAIHLRARNGLSLAVPTRSFAPEDRTRLERTIARRVKESQ